MIKVAIFGATGGIGKYAVQHSLNKGYHVKAHVRDKSKLILKHENLTIIQGEINDYESVSATIKGCDAVIWCVGVPMKKYTGMASLDGHRVLIKAMKDYGVSRLIDWATPSIPFKNDKKSLITVVPGLLAGVLFKQAKAEMIAIGELIVNSDLDWTFVRFMAPKDTPYTGKIKVGFGDVKMNFNISRSDIAGFMVEQVFSKQYIHSMPIIGS